MTKSIKDLLNDYRMAEPVEIQKIKAAVFERFQTEVRVALSGDQFIITVPNAALAGALRPQTYQIVQECGLKQRLVIRIGQ